MPATEIKTIRTKLCEAADDISGLHVYPYTPGSVVVPCFVVGPTTEIDYDAVYAGGGDNLRFTCLVLVARSDDEHGQEKLDGYLKSSGSGSLKAAIESDRTLGSTVDSTRVVNMRNYGKFTFGEAEYLGAEFLVEVLT